MTSLQESQKYHPRVEQWRAKSPNCLELLFRPDSVKNCRRLTAIVPDTRDITDTELSDESPPALSLLGQEFPTEVNTQEHDSIAEVFGVEEATGDGDTSIMPSSTVATEEERTVVAIGLVAEGHEKQPFRSIRNVIELIIHNKEKAASEFPYNPKGGNVYLVHTKYHPTTGHLVTVDKTGAWEDNYHTTKFYHPSNYSAYYLTNNTLTKIRKEQVDGREKTCYVQVPSEETTLDQALKVKVSYGCQKHSQDLKFERRATRKGTYRISYLHVTALQHIIWTS